MRRWVAFFAAEGHDVHVVTTKAASPPTGLRAQVHTLRLPRDGNPALALLHVALAFPGRVRALRRLLDRIQPDIVHVHYINDAAVLAWLAGARPLVLTAWGSDILVSPMRSRVRRQAIKAVLRRADLTTCDADHMRDRIIELGCSRDRLEVVFFGTDVTRYHPSRRDEAFLRQEIGMAPPVVISIRSLESIYDVETLVRAAPLVVSEVPEATFLIGGGGSLRASLEQLARDLGVAKNVRFLGPLSQDVLPTYLASADVYVSTALSDGGLAASTAEAMASGLPVVVTDVVDNRRWIQDGATGSLVPPRDPKALAARLAALLRDGEERKKLGFGGRKVIERRCNLQVEMNRMGILYERVARGN